MTVVGMNRFASRPRLLAAAAILALTALAASPAVAGTPASSNTLSLSSTTTVPSDPLTAQYTSLAASMMNYWATQSNQTLSQWTQSNGVLSANFTSGSTIQGSTLASLTSQLMSSGDAPQLSGVTSMSALLKSVTSAAGTPDGQATLSGMNLAQQMAGLHSTLAASPSSDSAVFGLFYDQGLSKMLAQSPGLFATARSLNSPAAQAAWSRALASASSATSLSLSALPDPCLSGMLSAASTGTATSSPAGCSPCDIAGSYLNSQISKIFNPSANSLLASNGGISVNGWSQLQGWLQSGTLKQNPSLNKALNPPASSLNTCAASSSAVSGALKQTLPGVFSNLGK